jgi:hypothetical protein
MGETGIQSYNAFAFAFAFNPHFKISVLNITFLKSSGHGCPIEENVQGRMFFRI